MEDEIFSVFYIPVKILTTLGLWVSKSASIQYKIYGIIMHLAFFEFYGSLMVMHLTQVHGIDDYAQLMSLLPVYFSCAIKTANFMTRVDAIEELFVMIRDCVKDFDDNRILRKRIEGINKIYLKFWACASFIVLLMMFSAVSKQTLGIKMWLPFKVDSPLKFWIVTLIQNLNLFGYIAINTAVNIVPVFFMSYTAGLLELLCFQLADLKEQKVKPKVNLPTRALQKSKAQSKIQEKLPPTPPTNRDKLIKAVNTHLKIIAITQKVEKIFAGTIFVESLISTFVLCTTSFLLTIISPITQTFVFLKTFFMLMTWLVQILLPCYYSELITTTSENLSTALYHSDWITENIKYRKIMIIFMENSKHSLKLLAMGYSWIDLKSFIKIANTAYTFFAVFKRADIKMNHRRSHKN